MGQQRLRRNPSVCSAHQGCAAAAAAAGMPGNADRLWMFENFSRYGAVVGLRVLVDEASGLCNGTGCAAQAVCCVARPCPAALTLVPSRAHHAG